MGHVRSKLTFSTVTIGAAVLVVGTAGTAYAANEWTGANIVNESLTGKDIKKGSLKSSDIGDGQVKSVDILDGSVTGADLQDATVGADDVAGESITSSHILDDTITASDIGTNAVGSDEVADFSLSNQDVGVLFAQINADGTAAASSGGATSLKLGGTGSYEVDFGRDITQCAFTATIGPAGGGSALGEVNVADRAGNPEAVFVDTNNSDGTAADKPFHLIVVC